MRRVAMVAIGASTIALSATGALSGKGVAAQQQSAPVQVIKPGDRKPRPVPSPTLRPIPRPTDVIRTFPRPTPTPTRPQVPQASDVLKERGQANAEKLKEARAREEAARNEPAEVCRRNGGKFTVTVTPIELTARGNDVDDIYGAIIVEYYSPNNWDYWHDDWKAHTSPRFADWSDRSLWASEGHNFKYAPIKFQSVKYTRIGYSEYRRPVEVVQNKYKRKVIPQPTLAENLTISFRLWDRDRGPFTGADDEFYLLGDAQTITQGKFDTADTRLLQIPSCEVAPTYEKNVIWNYNLKTNEKMASYVRFRVRVHIKR